MSAAFVLARFGDREKLLPAVAQLDSCPPVSRWDAVDGHVHLVISVNSTSSTLPDNIRNLVGVSEMMSFDIAETAKSERAPSPESVSAYLFIDAEPNQKAALSRSISEMPEVLSCTGVSGGCDLVVVISAETITALERVINDRIRPLDGILRLKHNHIIDLKKL
ncbi:MAG: Lrp/AsnC ligand binding domain-containing protein [Candidatus Zixiibacteriota bacterium]